MDRPRPDLNEVLDAALELVLEDTLGGVSIGSVAHRLNISEAELLEYSPSLTDLLVSMVNREYNAMFRVILDNVERDPNGGLLSRIFRYTLTAIYERPLARALYLSDPVGLNSIMRASYGFDHMPHLHLAHSFVESLQLAGTVRDDVNPEWVTAALSSVAAGVALMTPHDDLDNIIDGISLMIQRAVDAPVTDTTAGKAVFNEYVASVASRPARG